MMERNEIKLFLSIIQILAFDVHTSLTSRSSFETQDFKNFLRIDKSCLTAYYLVSVHLDMSLIQCHEVCEELRCVSFTFDFQQEVCFLSKFNSNSARKEFNKCGTNFKYTSYYERINITQQPEGGCVFPFVWKNKIHHECVKVGGREMCSTTNGFHQPISWLNCPKCFDPLRPKEYRGKLKESRNGNRCISWKFSVYKWQSSIYGLGDHPYCRNPDNDPNGVWCYVNITHHEFCNVPKCSAGKLSSLPYDTNICGLSSALKLEPKRKIVGGENADSSAVVPWQVGLVHKRRRTFDCGGVIIKSCFILTAAHCFKKSPHNEYQLIASFSGHFQQMLDIKEVFVHHSYNAFQLDHDIAIVELLSVNKQCLTFRSTALPVCLPSPDIKFPTGKTCVVSGAGKYTSERHNFTYQLQYAKIPLVSYQRCLNDTFLGSHLTENMLCAGYFNRNQDSCKGDSGSPLVCQSNDNRWYLWGLVSWGDECGDRPGVYTKVSRYLHWIKSITSDA